MASGYYLKQLGLEFVMLDAGERIGNAWRNRWDSLRLFSAARYNELPGMKYPGARFYYPTKDEYADYIAAQSGTAEAKQSNMDRAGE